MAMRLFLQDGPARLQILSPSHMRQFRDVEAAREFLRPLIAQAGNGIAIRRALGPAIAVTDGELLDALAKRIVAEGLYVVSCADTWLASIQGTLTESSAAASTAATAAATTQTTPLQDEEAAQAASTADQTEETHFIEIELLDDEGKPIADEAYFVELPDGSSKSGRTDARGFARIDGVDPGTAKVTFPDLDKKSYDPGGGG